MQIKKPKYPFAMYSYIQGKTDKKIYQRTIINSDIDEYNFLQTVPQGYKTQIDNLNKEELKSLPFVKRIIYKTPKWVFIVMGLIYTLIVWLASKYFS